MMNFKAKTLAVAVSGLVGVVSMPSLAADTIADAVKNGKAELSFRMRYEDVEQDTATSSKDAHGTTLKTRLNYLTDDYKGFKAFIEVDNVTAIDDQDYPTDSGEASEPKYADDAVIADPKGTEVNQAWLSYSNYDSVLKYGRQRIILDNQRFVGGVGFRQNEQTYEGVSFVNNSLQDTTIFYSYVSKVKRIFGDDASSDALEETESGTNLVNIKYSGFDWGTFVGYAYLIDEDDTKVENNTYGIRFSGKTGDFGYALEYADQEYEKGNTNQDYDAEYLLAEGSYTFSGVKFLIGYEELGSDDGDYGFSTPLATLHAFQGWTDQFLGTPKEGIEDFYGKISTDINGYKLMAVYHEFTANEDAANGDDDLGSEWGVMVGKKFGEYGINVKYAEYSEGDGDTFNKFDTEKLWVTFTADFK